MRDEGETTHLPSIALLHNCCLTMSQHATKTLSCCCCFLISIPQSPLILFRTCSGVNLKAFLTRRKFLNKINTSSEYRTECIRTIWICSRLTLNADGEFLHERENLQVQSYRNQVAKGDEALHHSWIVTLNSFSNGSVNLILNQRKKVREAVSSGRRVESVPGLTNLFRPGDTDDGQEAYIQISHDGYLYEEGEDLHFCVFFLLLFLFSGEKIQSPPTSPETSAAVASASHGEYTGFHIDWPCLWLTLTLSCRCI